MPHGFSRIAFTDAVKAEQTARGSRASDTRFDDAEEMRNAKTTAAEAAFLAQHDGFSWRR